jgi:hypothetical protein
MIKKYSFFYIISLATLLSCKGKNGSTISADGFVNGDNQENTISLKDTLNRTQILWLDTLKDLGQLKKGISPEVTFRFKNIGTKPLSIISVSAGCGCTSPKKPAGLIAPGKEGYVKATFDTKNQEIGTKSKNITVTTNTKPEYKTLIFTADVIQ